MLETAPQTAPQLANPNLTSNELHSNAFVTHLKKRSVVVIGALTVLVMVLPFFLSLFAQRTITTLGFARQEFPVGKVEMSLLMVNQSVDMISLRTESEQKINTITSTLSGFGASSLVASAPQVVPQPSGGYQYRQTLKFEATGAETLSKILNYIKAQNVVVVSALYTPADEATAHATLTAQSVANARQKAELIAGEQSLRITDVKATLEIESTVETGSSLSGNAETSTTVASDNSGKTKLQKTINVTFYARKKILGFL